MTGKSVIGLVLLTSTFLSSSVKAAALTSAFEELRQKAANSGEVFDCAEGTENDWSFTKPEADAEGKLTTEYYKIILKPENFSTTGSTVWRKAGENEKFDADTVAVYLPNKQTEYFKYDNVRPAGRKVYDIRQSSLSGEVDADFVGSVANVSGGAVYNNGTIDKITGDFVANSTTGGYAELSITAAGSKTLPVILSAINPVRTAEPFIMPVPSAASAAIFWATT